MDSDAGCGQPVHHQARLPFPHNLPTPLPPPNSSPYIFGPFILGPLVLHPFVLSPYVISPNILNPYVLSPIILNPIGMHILWSDTRIGTAILRHFNPQSRSPTLTFANPEKAVPEASNLQFFMNIQKKILSKIFYQCWRRIFCRRKYLEVGLPLGFSNIFFFK